MDSVISVAASISPGIHHHHHHHYYIPCTFSFHSSVSLRRPFLSTHSLSPARRKSTDPVVDASRSAAIHSTAPGPANSTPPKDGMYTVGDFMTKKEDLHVVEPLTTVEKALETLVEKRITGFPVVDADEKLVGVVSDYDLLALDSISGGTQADMNLFPDVDSSWKTFKEIQKLLGKNDGKVVGDLMTPAPLVVRETTNLEDAVRLLLETKYRRLPVVDGDGKLVGLITRGDIVRGALQIKHAIEKMR